ncbi:MAG: DUF58 domain-containing protein [Cyanobacteria bacterium P01_A01_bin.105]
MGFRRLADWLESRWATPAYSGWVVLGIALFFFGAATNTMAGWLYVMSGMMMAMLSISTMWPQQALKGLIVSRTPMVPVMAGQALWVDLKVANTTTSAKRLLQVRDQLPRTLAAPQLRSLPSILAQDHRYWRYEIPTHRRGVHTWQTVTLRSAAPLGLFWCSRPQAAPAKAVVYPQILPLTRCPLLDQLGDESGLQWQRDQSANAGTEGLTRALRPYRWGDPTRLIHWRTSARYGELRVRELEQFTSSPSITIALDTGGPWLPEAFEQAVIVAASLYIYGLKQGLSTQFWSGETGMICDRTAVLTTLAGILPGGATTHPLPAHGLIWLGTHRPRTLPPHSHVIGFAGATAAHSQAAHSQAALADADLPITPDDDLLRQLQQQPIAHR